MKSNIGLSVLLTIALSLVAWSCGKDDPEENGSDAPAAISVSASSLSFTAEGGSETLTITAPVKPAITAPDWITVPSAPFNQGSFKMTVTITAEANPAYEIRSGKIVISASGVKDVEVSVTQEAEEAPVVYEMNPVVELTNAKASEPAKKLYKFFLDNYGKKTLSGAMGGDAFGTGFTDYVNAQTGYYPAILGVDYLFLEWPAKAWSGCPDYGDISALKAACDKGNIIQVMWHWNVPKSKDTSDPNNYAFYSNSVNFSPKNAVTPGTWENEVIDKQIEKLAGYMKLLQDAGIPVLFRPLHEAAGDYGWGYWFWWGSDGADACVALWKYLRNKLEKTYGLNNLIWVWTVQTGNKGALADLSYLEAWYPGDDYVDMVGADLYVDKGTTQSSCFELINNSVKGRKIVALCECGNLLDMEKCFNESAPWAYFLVWASSDNGNWSFYSKNSDGSYGWNNSTADWKSALTGKYTLNRNDVPSFN